MHLTLLTRSDCHLCDEMERELRPLIGTMPLRVIDVDAPEHAALEARYGSAVPVLFAGSPAQERELCRYRLDRARLRVVLAEAREIR